MFIQTLLRVFVCGVFIVAASACATPGDESGTDSAGSIPKPLVDVSGSYKLIAVNGARIPATVSHGNAKIKVHAGDFVIRADGTCSTTSVFSPPSGGKVTQKSHATCAKKDSKLLMDWEGAGKNTGRFDGETFIMDNHGMIFVFSRSAAIDDSVKLDLADECDANIVAAGIEKAESGVFDDFNSALMTGRNRDGMRIGFLTFQDSANSAVNISTTSEHPPLAGEEAGNAVLRLNLDVKAWAGVIHNFENAAVNRWTPRDWRGFTEFSFWLYGSNSNTSLFVEILDNRRPCPKPVGAEVFTYPFKDDFSGWKQITVPFEKLVRKEVYNDAPNDGLGLAEVHGWAFGALNTGGTVIYYIDDFELR